MDYRHCRDWQLPVRRLPFERRTHPVHRRRRAGLYPQPAGLQNRKTRHQPFARVHVGDAVRLFPDCRAAPGHRPHAAATTPPHHPAHPQTGRLCANPSPALAQPEIRQTHRIGRKHHHRMAARQHFRHSGQPAKNPAGRDAKRRRIGQRAEQPNPAAAAAATTALPAIWTPCWANFCAASSWSC